MKLVTTTADLAGYYEDRSVAAPVAGMKATGFSHIDLSVYQVIYPGSPWIADGDRWKEEIDDCRRIAERDGLDFCQAHSPEGERFEDAEKKEAMIRATRRSLEACSMLGIPHTVFHAQPVKNGTREDFAKKNIEFLKLFADDTEKYGVDILIENSASAWNPEYYLMYGQEMAEFVERAGIPRLYINWDIGHGNVQGVNQYTEITAMGDRLHALHVQDNYGDRDSHMMPMAGTVNFDQVMKGLIDIGYRGDFTFEGNSTIRRSGTWPDYRRDILDSDKLKNVPLYIQQKQISVMYEIGKWMLESYGIEAE